MYKKLILSMLILFSVITLPAGTENAKAPEISKCTFVQFSVWPTLYEWPTGLNVYGVRIGLPCAYGGNTVVYGIDWGIFLSKSKNVNGLQISFSNWGDNGKGVQMGLVNKSINSSLLQIGVYNKADKDSHCIQIGIINELKNGFLPFFPIINFSI